MKILVVEDNAKHQKDARGVLKTLADVEAVFAWSLQSAIENMNGVDGVLTDIYMPFVDNRPQHAQHPMGVAVLMVARERNIPCVLVTAGYHHGQKYQPVCEFQRAINAQEIVDGTENYSEEAATKNWPKGLEVLRGLIEKRRSG